MPAVQQAKNFALLPVLSQYQGKRISTLIWGAVYFFLLALMSCGNLAQFGINTPSLRLGLDVTNIRDLKLQDNNAKVYLQGKVTHFVPLFKQQVYQLQDSTGTIWVLTHQAGSQPGDEMLVKGKLRYQSIPLAGKDFGELYVEEQERLIRSEG